MIEENLYWKQDIVAAVREVDVKNGFSKRRYESFKTLFSDLKFMLGNRNRIRSVMRNHRLSSAFIERLMLAVTAVNGCRYCSYFHARQAVKSGLAPDEINQLLEGTVDSCPDDEAVAVIYAQHWAEANAEPDPEAVAKLREAYGEEMTENIHLVLRMIRAGNLMGNSWDYVLYRLTFGKKGI